ncbi:MAG: hypothetical protein KKD44_27155 [Proteobacteria bacterium]|nr:hypothetical protein [Pseudomonadota bacterium]
MTAETGECRELQVAAAKTALANRITKVKEVVERLENRIESVLAPQEPTKLDACDKTQAYAVPLAQGLQVMKEELNASIDRLESIIDRIEI